MKFKTLVKRTIIGCFLNIGLVSVCLLLPAKLLATEASWLWEEGMAFLGLYSVGVFLGCFYLCVYYPKSMEARLIVKSSSQPVQDKMATAVLSAVGLTALSFVPTDVFYLHALTEPILLVRLAGLGLAQIGLILMFVTIVQNEFAQPVVSIQEDRGHVLVDTGLYGRVRHPLYTSFLIWFCGAALWLGSMMMASFGTGILMLALWPRILIEESTLKRDLDGYADYMRRVKYRIIPGLF